MSTEVIRVGIVGLKPGESCADVAHVPALRSMPDKFIIAGVANKRLESSRAAAETLGIPDAVASADEPIALPEIDAVGLQRLIDAIEKSARSGSRVTLAPSNRAVPLPE
jgi:predicted dehydrogenase